MLIRELRAASVTSFDKLVSGLIFALSKYVHCGGTSPAAFKG